MWYSLNNIPGEAERRKRSCAHPALTLGLAWAMPAAASSRRDDESVNDVQAESPMGEGSDVSSDDTLELEVENVEDVLSLFSSGVNLGRARLAFRRISARVSCTADESFKARRCRLASARPRTFKALGFQPLERKSAFKPSVSNANLRLPASRESSRASPARPKLPRGGSASSCPRASPSRVRRARTTQRSARASRRGGVRAQTPA